MAFAQKQKPNAATDQCPKYVHNYAKIGIQTIVF